MMEEVQVDYGMICDIPPPGDVRNVLAALSDVEPLIEKMFQHRFTDQMNCLDILLELNSSSNDFYDG